MDTSHVATICRLPHGLPSNAFCRKISAPNSPLRVRHSLFCVFNQDSDKLYAFRWWLCIGSEAGSGCASAEHRLSKFLKYDGKCGGGCIQSGSRNSHLQVSRSTKTTAQPSPQKISKNIGNLSNKA